MKQRDMIRYLHMGCGESLAARQFVGEVAESKELRKQTVKPRTEEYRRKRHEGQR